MWLYIHNFSTGAVESEDFILLSIVATFEIGATEEPQCFDIVTINDDDVEQVEVVIVEVSMVEGNLVVSPSSLSITITDDDDGMSK